MNTARLAVVASLVIILGVPFLFRPTDAGRARPADAMGRPEPGRPPPLSPPPV